jgi:energy-coupling factor transport system ATP-binding protein
MKGITIMPQIEFKDYSFIYSNNFNPQRKALDNISLLVEKGEFVVVAGPIGCGKTTLLRALKSNLLQKGSTEGNIFYNGKNIKDLTKLELASEIGIVFQNPDNQIVMETVIEELCFSLENIGLSNQEIRRRVAEISMYFGLQNLLHKNVNELSGGQKQLINIASVLCLKPKVLLLDEPTSQLDAGATFNFISILKKLSSELGITIIMSAHRLQEVYKLADKVIFLDNGRIEYNNSPNQVVRDIWLEKDEKFMIYIPEYIAYLLENNKTIEFVDEKTSNLYEILENNSRDVGRVLISAKSIYFSYDSKKTVIKNLSLELHEGEIVSILGENGAGKTTLIKLLAGLIKQNSGKIKREKNIRIEYISQNTSAHFTCDTVKDELENINKEFKELSNAFGLDSILDAHPLDISIGEQQKLAIAMAILSKVNIILIDEPTKGLDEISKKVLEKIVNKLKETGVTIVIATQDLGFSKQISARNLLLFDGEIVF